MDQEQGDLVGNRVGCAAPSAGGDGDDLGRLLLACAEGAADRFVFWSRFHDRTGVRTMAEIGVWKGEFAAAILARCAKIERYCLVDPWRHLERWNRPWNLSDAALDACRAEALHRTAFARDRTILLEGTTLEAADHIPDRSLDAAYIDGDHTLRGITIDMVAMARKVRKGGWICGDDFHPTIAHHSRHEPILVFPFVVHFAEAMRLPVYALPFRQFLVHNEPGGFVFHDLVGGYDKLELRPHMGRLFAVRMRVSEALRTLRGRGRG